MTPEQRAALENTLARAIFGWTVTEAVRRALIAIEAAGYTILLVDQLAGALDAARAEGAREMREAAATEIDCGGCYGKPCPRPDHCYVEMAADIRALPLPSAEGASAGEGGADA